MNCPVLLSTHFQEQEREFGLDMLTGGLVPANLSLFPPERGGMRVLWICFIQPEMLDKRMEMVLREYDHIYAGESLTAVALVEHGLVRVIRQPAR